MAARGSSPIPTSSPRTRVEKGRIKKPRCLTLRSHKNLHKSPAIEQEPVPGTFRDFQEETLERPVTPDEVEDDDEVHQDTEDNPTQEPPALQSNDNTSNSAKYRLTPGLYTTSYAAVAAMEASIPHLNMTIRPSRRGQLVISAQDLPTNTFLEQQENVRKLDFTDRPTTIIIVYDLDLPLEPVLQHPFILTAKRCEGRAGRRSHKLEESSRDPPPLPPPLSSPSASGAPFAPGSISRNLLGASAARSLATTRAAALVQRSVECVVAGITLPPIALPGTRLDTTPPPTARIAEDLIILGMTDVPFGFSGLQTVREQIVSTTFTHVSHVEYSDLKLTTPLRQPTTPLHQPNPNPCRDAIPELPSPPSLHPVSKPQRPPKPPPKSKRSPSRTPSTPSPLIFTSPPTLPEPKKSSSSLSAPVTHISSSSHSLREFLNLPTPAVRSKPIASCPAKPALNIDNNIYTLSACPMDAILAAISNLLRSFLQPRKIKCTQKSLDDFILENAALELNAQFPS
ncbi:uncharacterized protein [Palaemon carinicauda]|uniref:uncharacterized protein n=1 Tax=Palaemon carinicauda TaxID=392227 RepID=UPI0035B674A4